MKNKVLPNIVISVILAGAVALAGGYRWGHSQGEKRGYSRGYTSGEKSVVIPESYFTQYMNLQTEHNKLVTDYNNLLEQARNYVNANQFQVRKPVTCNTFNDELLNSSRTTCY